MSCLTLLDAVHSSFKSSLKNLLFLTFLATQLLKFFLSDTCLSVCNDDVRFTRLSLSIRVLFFSPYNASGGRVGAVDV